jgi:hypothetical protein
MNNKGQVGLGTILMVFITVVVGVILLIAAAQELGKSTNTDSIALYSIGTQTNGTTYYFADYKHLSSVTVYGNGTANPVLLSAGNYTITNNVINPTGGAISASLLPTSEYTGTVWQINATAQPLGYVPDGGSRSIVSLIVILFALAVAIVALEPTLRSGILDAMGR